MEGFFIGIFLSGTAKIKPLLEGFFIGDSIRGIKGFSPPARYFSETLLPVSHHRQECSLRFLRVQVVVDAQKGQTHHRCVNSIFHAAISHSPVEGIRIAWPILNSDGLAIPIPAQCPTDRRVFHSGIRRTSEPLPPSGSCPSSPGRRLGWYVEERLNRHKIRIDCSIDSSSRRQESIVRNLICLSIIMAIPKAKTRL